MSDLRVIKRRNKYVIMNFDNDRIEVKGKNGKSVSFKFKKEAKAYRDALNAKVIREEIKLTGRIKFLPKYKEYAEWRLELAEDEYTRDTVQGVKDYLSYFKKYLVHLFPDIHLDEVDANVLEQFVLDCNKRKIPYKTTSRIISRIQTFLRYCLEKKLHNDFESALSWKIHDPTKGYLQPEDNSLMHEKKAEVITPEEASAVLDYVERHKDRSRNDAIAYGGFIMLSTFGMRQSEIIGLRRSKIDFERRIVYVRGMYDSNYGKFRKRTKTVGSLRDLTFTPRQAKHIKWFYDYMSKLRPHNIYLFSGFRGENPIGLYTFRKCIYRTYEAVGLAKLRWWKQDNQELYEVLECRFSGCPSKTWRHYNATMMIDNMAQLGLSQNYIKGRLGHTLWSTTKDRYGNHNMAVTDAVNQRKADLVEAALGYAHKPEENFSRNEVCKRLGVKNNSITKTIFTEK